jgi:hypothetical protein
MASSIVPLFNSGIGNTNQSLNQQVQAAAQPLHASSDGTTSTLTLGTVQFADFEIPEKIGTFGGKQLTAVHEFVGGLRQVQTFGPQPERISWSGYLMGGDPNTGAAARAQAIDTMRKQGSQVLFQWGQFRFQVVITQFHVEPQTDWVMPYNIECEVLQDLSPGAVLSSAVQGPDQVFQNLINDGQATSAATSLLQPQNVSTITNAINTISSVAQTWGGSLQSISGPDNQAATTALTASIDSLQPIAADPPNQLDATTAVTLISVMKNMVNMLQGFTGTPPKTISVINPNLFALAAVQFGDVTQWPTLAALNNLPVEPLQVGSFPNFILEK